jgi:predicted RNase H-like HicB family nuclease
MEPTKQPPAIGDEADVSFNLVSVLNQPTLTINLSDGGDGYITAECIDIPGCISQGKTRDEALANIVDAVSVCLEIITEQAAAKLRQPDAVAVSDSYKFSLSTSELVPA